MEHREVLYIEKETLDEYNKLLSTEPKTESDCLGEDETIIKTVDFENEFEMDIKICGVKFKDGESNLPWAEAVLFKDGNEVECTEPSDAFDGEWVIEYNGDTFIVEVTSSPFGKV